jgi:ATP-dependent Clp protease ATP-binding subunit ClpC
MFERFTDRARRVIVAAQNEARGLDHNYIGPEHILLGLLEEGSGVGFKVFVSMGISTDAVRERVEEVVGRGQGASQGHIPFTPAAKKVLELSLRESLDFGHTYIGTEHLLLGLIREGEGVAAQVLADFGVDLDRAREQVAQLLAGRSLEAPGARGGPGQALADDLRDRLASVAERLAVIERRLRDAAAEG